MLLRYYETGDYPGSPIGSQNAVGPCARRADFGPIVWGREKTNDAVNGWAPCPAFPDGLDGGSGLLR